MSVLTVSAGYAYSERTGTITLTSGSSTKVITVIQTSYASKYLTFEATDNGSLYLKTLNPLLTNTSIQYSLDDGDN